MQRDSTLDGDRIPGDNRETLISTTSHPAAVPSLPVSPTPYREPMSHFLRTALDQPTPSAATREHYRRARRPRRYDDHIATRITWSTGDDDEHAWYWRATNSSGRVVAYGYAHEQDEEDVVKLCGESGAVVAEDVEWRSE